MINEAQVRSGSARGSARPQVLIRVVSADRECLERHGVDARWLRANDNVLDARSRSASIRGIVCDLGLLEFCLATAPAVRCAEALGIPLVLRVLPSRANARALIALARIEVDWRVSVRGVDDLVSAVDRLLADERPDDATRHIVQRIALDCPMMAQECLVAMSIVGRARLLARQFAGLWGQPLRTLELRVTTARLPAVSILLGWMLALHAAFRIEKLDWPVKRAGHEAGFVSSEAFAEYVRRHVGLRPASMRAAGTFVALLERFSDLIGRGDQRAVTDKEQSAKSRVTAPSVWT
jgi:AraC-like DNA-binding protein